MIKELHLKHVGPAEKFNLRFGDRLNIFTGDNGLGKTFMLDIIWWALTGTWASRPALPHLEEEPAISYRISGKTRPIIPRESKFDFSRQRWSRDTKKVPKPGLVIYIKVDGSFSVWDPARNYRAEDVTIKPPAAYHFTPEQLWDGLEEKDKILCNGLIRDWVKWQYQPNQMQLSPFKLLSAVIEQLSPRPDEWMKPGEPRRISLEDVRDIPTIELPYDNVPVTHASAGMKRILGLAYLLVWSWDEHLQAAKLRKEEPADRLILLMDEVEAHLHPQWQRSILSSLLILASLLEKQMKTQLIVTTHSPLVLASAEPLFDEKQDKLFVFDLEDREVNLKEFPWAKQGDVVGWLTSEIFGLEQARSKDAELAIDAAYTFMRNEDMDKFPRNLRTKNQIHKELQRVLAGNDPFWVRWVVATEKNGK